MKKIVKAMWRERTSYLQLAPVIIMLLVVAFIPMAYGIIIGLTDFSFFRPGELSFVGLSNFFKQVVDSRYHEALWHTLFYTIIATGGSYLIGLGIALLLNAKKLKAKKAFRVIFLLPWVITPVVVGVMWAVMLRSRFGLINYVTTNIGLSNINFLGDPKIALRSVLIPELWRSVPFVIIMLFARLRGIPAMLYEAARVDGATRWQQLLYVTLPELKEISEILLLFMVLMNTKVFDLIWVLTQGGPADSTQVAMTYIYDLSFRRFEIGAGAAASYIPMIVLFAVGFLYIRMRERQRVA